MRMTNSVLKSLLFSLAVALFFGSANGALMTGDILVADPAASTLWRVDPSTGEEQAFAQVPGARDVAVSAAGEIYVLGSGVSISAHVFRVDPVSALVTQVNPTPLGFFAFGLGLGPDGTIYVAGGGSGTTSSVKKVNPSTGAVGNVTTTWTSPSIPTDVVAESSSTLLVSSLSTLGGVYRVDLTSGSQVAVRTGSPWVGPTGITDDGAGGYVVTDVHANSVSGWDGTSAAPNVISQGIPFVDPRQSVVDAAGMILVADGNGPSGTPGYVIKVDPSDGGTTILAQGQPRVGLPPLGLDSPAGIAIYAPIPEPSAGILAALGFAISMAACRRRRAWR